MEGGSHPPGQAYGEWEAMTKAEPRLCPKDGEHPGRPASGGRAEKPGQRQAAGQPEDGVLLGRKHEDIADLREGEIRQEESSAAEEQPGRLLCRR